MHDPVEKNLKHKTDVLSWDEVAWETCDLNFRAPSAESLSLSPGGAYSQLVLAAGCGVAVTLMFGCTLMPVLAIRSVTEPLLVAAVVAILVAGGFYLPLPRRVANQKRISIAALMGGTVLALFVILRIAYGQSVFNAGIVTWLCLALPISLLVADQMAAHVVHWVSADPRFDRNPMVVLRNAWCGRFMTEHIEELRQYGVSKAVNGKLKRYYLGHVAVGCANALAGVVGLLIGSLADVSRVGMVIVGLSVASTFVLAVLTHARTAGVDGLFSGMLGHWFEYQKDTLKPPWMLQSPGGSQLSRAFLSYVAVILVACCFVLLGLVDMSWSTRMVADLSQASQLEIGVVAAFATVSAPLWLLSTCFIVAAPTMAIVDEVTEEIDHDQE